MRCQNYFERFIHLVFEIHHTHAMYDVTRLVHTAHVWKRCRSVASNTYPLDMWNHLSVAFFYLVWGGCCLIKLLASCGLEAKRSQLARNSKQKCVCSALGNKIYDPARQRASLFLSAARCVPCTTKNIAQRAEKFEPNASADFLRRGVKKVFQLSSSGRCASVQQAHP